MSYQELRIWAEMYTDAVQARIAATNRAERGGVHPDLYAIHIKNLETVEHDCALELRRSFRSTVPRPLRDWQKESPGIGEHLLARLVGVVGNPYIAEPKFWRTGKEGEDRRVLVSGEPYARNVAKLWAYCGVGDPTKQRRKGSTQAEALSAGIPLAKSLLRLLAEACVKVNRGPYREVYDAAREKYADRTHVAECRPCGPKGKPAQPGSEWSKAHQHAAALRKVSKAILKDMWVIYRDDYQIEIGSMLTL